MGPSLLCNGAVIALQRGRRYIPTSAPLRPNKAFTALKRMRFYPKTSIRNRQIFAFPKSRKGLTRTKLRRALSLFACQTRPKSTNKALPATQNKQKQMILPTKFCNEYSQPGPLSGFQITDIYLSHSATTLTSLCLHAHGFAQYIADTNAIPKQTRTAKIIDFIDAFQTCPIRVNIQTSKQHQARETDKKSLFSKKSEKSLAEQNKVTTFAPAKREMRL